MSPRASNVPCTNRTRQCEAWRRRVNSLHCNARGLMSSEEQRVAPNLATISVATHYSWTSPTLPKLEAPGSFIHLDSNEASWVGSLNSLGNIFGPFLGGWLIDRVGRRWTILIADLMNLLSWVVLLVATSVWHIYLGRFLGGFSGGILFVAIPVYVAEIAEVSYNTTTLGLIEHIFLIYLKSTLKPLFLQLPPAKI
ncbi:hypothetical protein J6590_103020 [Homalodisca vitripennis]|nr:hypothetical protein J6590_103020 [Homalodisca vitripennis]